MRKSNQFLAIGSLLIILLGQEAQHATWTAITALSAHDIWVIGQANGVPQALHWDGKNWTSTSMPTLSPGVVTLAGITAIAPDNAWIVGSSRSRKYPNDTYQPLMLHWDGTSWHEVAGATTPTGSTPQFGGISAVSATDIWVVGNIVEATRVSQELIEHWDGKQWGMAIWPVFYGQLTDNSSVGLADISGTPGGQIIAVGSSVVFTQNPPIDDAARNPAQPFVLASCH